MIETTSGEKSLEADIALVAIGRGPNTQNLGLEKAQIKSTEKGFIVVDNQLRTNQPHIFAIGDVVGPPLLAHKSF